MKRLLAVAALLLLIVSPAFALSDADYLKFKKNASFARADKKLTQVYNDLKKSMHPKHFEELKKNQRAWIATGRDQEARSYIKEGYSRVEAYTMATNDRARDLPEIAENIRKTSSAITGSQPSTRKTTPTRKTTTTTAKKVEPESYEVPDDEEEDDYGEIEENRFTNTSMNDPAGNYTRQNSKGKGGFMTVIITDKSEMEAEITISIENPEATWSATGWIDDNVLEVSDKDYSDCQATLTFSNGRVKIETSDSDDWDEVLGSSNRLDGTYIKK